MGIFGQSNSRKLRNMYASNHKISKLRKKQQRNDKAKLQLESIKDNSNELVTGVQFRNKNFKSTTSGVPISGKRRRKLLKSLKRNFKEKTEEERAEADVEMKDVKKKAKKRRPKKQKSDLVTPMEIATDE